MSLRHALPRAPAIARILWRLGRGRPTFASLNLLNRCNQACPMCAVRAGPDVRLRLGEVERIAGALRRGGVRVVEVSGGEPFLHPELPGILRHLDRAGLLFTFNTNATAISDEGLAALARARGLLQVAVSLDSLDRARYHHLRGADLLPRALAGLERLRAARLPGTLKLNVALSRHNHGELAALLAFARERGLFLSVFPVSQGPGAHRSDGGGFDASDAERRALAESFDDLARRRRRGEPLWEASGFYRAAARHLRGEPLPPCGAGRIFLDVRADGSVAPCIDLPAVTTAAALASGPGWERLAAGAAASAACQATTPCCYTCTIGLAVTARAPLRFALESARVLLAAARRPAPTRGSPA